MYVLDEHFSEWYHEKTASSNKTKKMKRFVCILLILVAFSMGYAGYLFHYSF
jgi:flagellar basal body-associated protein FliL